MCFRWSEKSKRVSSGCELMVHPPPPALRPVVSQWPLRMTVFNVMTADLWKAFRMKHAAAAAKSSVSRSDPCRLVARSCILRGCVLNCFQPARQQSAKLSFTETKMSEQHFRPATEPERSRFPSLSFKRLQVLTKFSATGSCSVPSSLPRLSLSGMFKISFPCHASYSMQTISCLKALLLQLTELSFQCRVNVYASCGKCNFPLARRNGFLVI